MCPDCLHLRWILLLKRGTDFFPVQPPTANDWNACTSCSANTRTLTPCHFSPFFPQLPSTVAASLKMRIVPSVPMRCQCPVKINLLVDYLLLNGKRIGMSFRVSKPERQKGCFPDEWRSLCTISGMGLSIHGGDFKITSFAVRIRASPFAQERWWRPSYLEHLFFLEDTGSDLGFGKLMSGLVPVQLCADAGAEQGRRGSEQAHRLPTENPGSFGR